MLQKNNFTFYIYHYNLRILMENPQLKILVTFNNFEKKKWAVLHCGSSSTRNFHTIWKTIHKNHKPQVLQSNISMICLLIYSAGPFRPWIGQQDTASIVVFLLFLWFISTCSISISNFLAVKRCLTM